MSVTHVEVLIQMFDVKELNFFVVTIIHRDLFENVQVCYRQGNKNHAIVY